MSQDRKTSFIEALGIDRFYELEGRRISNLSPGLNLLFGPNEAGKTTLLQFIRSIFFGFPQKVPRDWGGRIYFKDRDLGKAIIIERLGGTRKGRLTIRTGDGEKLSSAYLANITRGANERIFRNCFAFGLDELQSMSSLEEKEVKEAIFAAASGTSPENLKKIRTFFNEHEDTIFKPRGQRPKLNRLIHELKDVDMKIRELQKEIKDTSKEEEEISALKGRLPSLDKTIHGIRGEIVHLELIEQLYDKWLQFCHLEDDLKSQEVDTTDFLIEEGIEQRLNALLEHREKLAREKKAIEEEIREIGEKASRLVVDEALVEKSEEIFMISKKYNYILEIVKQREELSARKNLLEERLDSLSTSLGTGLRRNEAQSVEHDTSFVTRKKTSSLYSKLKALEDNVHGLRKELDALGDTLSELQSKADYTELKIKDVTLKRKRLEEGQKKAHSLFSSYEKLLSEQKILTNEISMTRASLRQYMLPIPLLTAGIAYILLREGITSNTLISIMIIILTCIMLGNVYLVFRKKQRIRDTGEKLDAIMEEMGRLKNEILALYHDNRHLLTQTSHSAHFNLQNQGKDLLRRIVFQFSLSLEALNGHERHLQDTWKETQEKIYGATERIEQLRSSISNKEELYSRRKSELTTILKQYGLEEMVDEAVFFQYLDRLERAKELMGEITSLEVRLTEIQGILDRFMKDASSSLEGVLSVDKGHLDSAKEIYRALQGIKDQITENMGKRDLLEELEKQQQKKEKELEETVMELKNYEIEIGRILDTIQAKDVDEFWQLFEKIKKNQGLEREISILSIELSQVGEDFRAIFSRYKRDELRVCVQDLKAKLSELHEKRDEILKAIGSYKEKIRQIQKKDRLKELRQRREQLLTETQHLAHKWAVIRIGAAIFQQAKRSFEEKSQPEVIRLGSKYFNVFTHGKYEKIYLDMERGSITVSDGPGRLKEISELSRGTREQLFLALRFGYILTLPTNLPVIMDDILVNFDDQRQRFAALALDELARKKQIFFFTCHKSTMDSFKADSSKTFTV